MPSYDIKIPIIKNATFKRNALCVARQFREVNFIDLNTDAENEVVKGVRGDQNWELTRLKARRETTGWKSWYYALCMGLCSSSCSLARDLSVSRPLYGTNANSRIRWMDENLLTHHWWCSNKSDSSIRIPLTLTNIGGDSELIQKLAWVENTEKGSDCHFLSTLSCLKQHLVIIMKKIGRMDGIDSLITWKIQIYSDLESNPESLPFQSFVNIESHR